MKVAIVVFDDVQALDVAGPLDVFAEANTFLPEHQKYEVFLLGNEAGTVSCSNGMQLAIPYSYADFDTPFDLLLVAGGPQLPNAEPRPEFLKWLQDQARGATRFGSVCNGAFVLAHAGLLDGKDVTTHWADADRLADEFPQARVQPDRIFIRDGRLFTSAGVTAGIDLCLSLVAEDWGHELAVRVAKRLVVYIQREGGQSQYSPYVGVRKDQLSDRRQGAPVRDRAHYRRVIDRTACQRCLSQPPYLLEAIREVCQGDAVRVCRAGSRRHGEEAARGDRCASEDRGVQLWFSQRHAYANHFLPSAQRYAQTVSPTIPRHGRQAAAGI